MTAPKHAPPSWADAQPSDGDPEVPEVVLYSLVGRATRARLEDFSPALHSACDAIELANDDLKEALSSVVSDMRKLDPPSAEGYDHERHYKLACFYNESQRRFVMVMRGTLMLFRTTGVRSCKEDQPAVMRVSGLCEMSETPKRLRARIQAMLASSDERTRKNADVARRRSRLAEAEFFRKILCVMHGEMPEIDGEDALWDRASVWARRFAPGRPLMDRMHDCLSAVLQHKRSIDWERDSMWAYGAPRGERLPFVGGLRGGT